MNDDFQARLAHAQKMQLLIVASTVIVGFGIGLIVGLIEHSVGWAIVALLGAGVAFFVVGSLLFLTLGGYEWLRAKRGR
jgi:hypothetical protein